MRSDVQGWRTLIGAVSTNTTPANPGSGDVVELRRVECVLTESLFKRLLRKVFPDQRRQERTSVPSLVGYLGSVRSTKPYEVGDISLSGFCLLTDERWSPGTEMPVTLERTSAFGEISESFTVQATVVRRGKNGVGFSILLCENESNAAFGTPLRVRWTSKPEMAQFLKRLNEQQVLPMQPADGTNPIANPGVQIGEPSLHSQTLTKTGSCRA